MHPSSAEYSIVRTYLDWLADPALVEVEPRPARPPTGAEGPRRRPLRPGEDQGTDPRIPGRSQAQEGHEGADPLLRRPAGDGQDLAGQEHRQGAGPRVRPGQPGGRPRRGRDPRPPPHLRRRHARPDHPGDPQGRHEQPGLHARRGRQARRRLPRRPLGRAPRSARPRAELDASATITSTSTSTSRRSCSSPRRTCSRRSPRRCSTGWRSSSCRATARKRRR